MTKQFFDSVRESLFRGKLNQKQVDGMNEILRASAGYNIRHRAYMLATAYHETGTNMMPNTESLNYTSASRIRSVWPSRFPSVSHAEPYVRRPQDLANKVYNGRMGNREGTNDGWNYRGRGQVHITGRSNYEKASLAIGVDLLTHPDTALSKAVASKCLVIGMSEGWYTGKSLSDYNSYYDMRRVVNGVDSASIIAEYAVKFESALNLIQGGEEPRRTFLSIMMDLFLGVFRK